MKQLNHPYEYLMQTLRESVLTKESFLKDAGETLIRASEALANGIRQGGKVLIFGNGGSAADAQHMAAEMVGKLFIDRRPLPVLALTTDSSILTAIGNDYGYEQVFLRQVQALAKSGDIVLAISTSGNSKNVLLALQAAKTMGCFTIGLTGGSGGKLKEICDLCLCAAHGANSSRIQETHIFAIHSIVDILDRFYLKGFEDLK